MGLILVDQDATIADFEQALLDVVNRLNQPRQLPAGQKWRGRAQGPG